VLRPDATRRLTCDSVVVELRGFEPLTPCMPCRGLPARPAVTTRESSSRIVEDRQPSVCESRPHGPRSLTLRAGRSQSSQRRFAAPLLPYGRQFRDAPLPTLARLGGYLGA
jgi:hypothetical protein